MAATSCSRFSHQRRAVCAWSTSLCTPSRQKPVSRAPYASLPVAWFGFLFQPRRVDDCPVLATGFLEFGSLRCPYGAAHASRPRGRTPLGAGRSTRFLVIRFPLTSTSQIGAMVEFTHSPPESLALDDAPNRRLGLAGCCPLGLARASRLQRGTSKRIDSFN